MFCKKCGKHLPDDIQFCIHCGTPVNTKKNSHHEYQDDNLDEKMKQADSTDTNNVGKSETQESGDDIYKSGISRDSVKYDDSISQNKENAEGILQGGEEDNNPEIDNKNEKDTETAKVQHAEKIDVSDNEVKKFEFDKTDVAGVTESEIKKEKHKVPVFLVVIVVIILGILS